MTPRAELVIKFESKASTKGRLARINYRIRRAGTPTTVTSAGTSSITTAPAPTTAFSPADIPASTTAPDPTLREGANASTSRECSVWRDVGEVPNHHIVDYNGPAANDRAAANLGPNLHHGLLKHSRSAANDACA